MSVPYGGRPAESIVETLRRAHGDNFYILYFQDRLSRTPVGSQKPQRSGTH
jgi:hypothetical protein